MLLRKNKEEQNPSILIQALPGIIFLISFLFINLLQYVARPYSPDGVHFQYSVKEGSRAYLWTSDMMMQTLPIIQLRETPIKSLWYLHKQPPMLDLIRAIIAQLSKNIPDKYLLRIVDMVLYFVWALFFSLTASLVYIWLKRLTNPKFSLIASLFWIIHPAAIFYATFLDSTLLSSLWILLFFYELWRINKTDGSLVRLTLWSALIFYTRTVFQWYFFPLLFISLFISKVPIRNLVKFIVIISLLVLPYLAKQYILFKTISSTTYTGYHKCGLIWYYPKIDEVERIRSSLKLSYPVEAVKYSGGDW